MFGKTIICQNLEVAGAYTRSHHLNSITLDGDKYDRKGAITGGYHDVRSSRIDAVKQLKHWEARADEENKSLVEVKTTLQRLDQEITQIVGKLQVAEGKLVKIRREGEPLIAEAISLQKDQDTIKTRIARLEAAVTSQQSSIRSIKAETAAYQAELKTKMESTLSNLELVQLGDLNTLVDQTKRDFVELSTARAEVRSSVISIAGTDYFLARSNQVDFRARLE